MDDLKLTPVIAYTVHSADDERSSSDKGLYKDYAIASTKAPKSGWYDSDGEVREKKNIYTDESGELYEVKHLGQFDDVSEKYRQETITSIKAKLTKEELELLGIK